MAELLEQRFSQISELTVTPSSGGVFEISVGKELIFSKKNQGRYPDEGEIARLFEEAAK